MADAYHVFHTLQVLFQAIGLEMIHATKFWSLACFVFVLQCWGWNSGPCTCQANPLPLSYIPNSWGLLTAYAFSALNNTVNHQQVKQQNDGDNDNTQSTHQMYFWPCFKKKMFNRLTLFYVIRLVSNTQQLPNT